MSAPLGDRKYLQMRRRLRESGRMIRALSVPPEGFAELEARATGGDVVVRLLHEVGEFRVMLGEHASRLSAVERRMDSLANRVDSLASRMDSVAGAMSEASEHIEALASHARKMNNQLGKVSKTLVEATQRTESRFDAMEQRLARLEAKG